MTETSNRILSEELRNFPRTMKNLIALLIARIVGMLALLIGCVIYFPKGESIPVTARIYLAITVAIFLGIMFWVQGRVQSESDRLLLAAFEAPRDGLSEEDYENLWRGYRIRPYLRRSGILMETDVKVGHLMKSFLERAFPMTGSAKEVLDWLREKVAYLKYEDPRADWSWLESS